MLIKILRIFFSLLIIYQIYILLLISREGLVSGTSGTSGNYQSYNDTTATLSNKNAANIQVLQEDIEKCNCSNIYTILTDLSGQIQTIQNQLNSYSQNNVSPNINPEESSQALSSGASNNSLALMNNNTS